MKLVKKLVLGCCAGAFFLALAAITYLCYLYCHREFKPDEFHHPVAQSMEITFAAPSNKADVEKILSQKFSHVGFGKQMTVYGSEDGKHVLKLFNPRPPLVKERFRSLDKLTSLCSLKWFSGAYFKKEERLRKLFDRHVLAFEELKEETGLVYLHLNRSTALKQKVQVRDRDGRIYQVDLAKTPFVLQRRATLAGGYLQHLRDTHDEKGLQEALAQLKKLFHTRAQKKITDRIQTLNNNYGFIDGKAVQIDFGRIIRDQTLSPDTEVEKILRNIPQ